MRCWNCGADNREEAKYCFVCGFQLQRVQALLKELESLRKWNDILEVTIQCLLAQIKSLEEELEKHLPVDETVYCPKCGAPVISRAMYCWQCGFVVRPVVCLNQNCLAPQPQDHKFCDYCGTRLYG